MRIYDTRLGRFLSVDPLTTKYPYWAPYLFAGNNPIKFIDVLGMGPGDKFNTIEEAAHDFAVNYNDNSIKEKIEYGTTIIRVKDHKEIKTISVNQDGSLNVKVERKVVYYYTYVTPRRGSRDYVLPPNPIFKRKVAYAHTHGHSEPENYDGNKFSPDDIAYADNRRLDAYVATPNGSLLKYDHTKYYVPEKWLDGDLLDYKDIASDSNEKKNRRSNIDPESLPSNEPSKRGGFLQLLLGGASAQKADSSTELNKK